MNSYNKEMLQKAVNESTNIYEVQKNLGLKPSFPGSTWLKSVIEKFNISISHFVEKEVEFVDYSKLDISNGFRRTRRCLKRYLDFHNVSCECVACGLNSWRGVPLSLDIDHIDGDPVNNQLNNLQYLCPNCHRVKTKEFSDTKVEVKKCECGKTINQVSTWCKTCSPKYKRKWYKIDWPSDEFFQEEVWKTPMRDIAKKLGVSDKTVKDHLIRQNISGPSRESGYWQNLKAGRFDLCAEIRLKLKSTVELPG